MPLTDIPSLTAALKAKCLPSITSKLSRRPTGPLFEFLEFLPGRSFEQIVERCWVIIFMIGTHKSFDDAVAFAIEKDKQASGDTNEEVQQFIREEMEMCLRHFGEEARWVLVASTFINLGMPPQEAWERLEAERTLAEGV